MPATQKLTSPATSVTQALVLAALSAIALLSQAAPVLAQACNVSVQAMAFGSLKTQSMTNASGVATISASCTGLPYETIRLCPQTSTGDVPHATSGDTASLALYSDSMRTTPLSGGFDIGLDGTGNGTGSLTLYGRLSPKTGPLRPGTYSATVSLNMIGNYVSEGAFCAAAAPTLTPTAALRKPSIAVARKVTTAK